MSPHAETWNPYSESYSINEDQPIDAVREMVYPTPRARNIFEPMEVEELSATLDNNTPPTAYNKAYYDVGDAVISSSAVVLYFPPSVEDNVVPYAIQLQVASVISVYDP